MRVNPALQAITDKQWGYFTAAQAVAAGYIAQVQSAHVKRDDWLRCDRGIYRLKGHEDNQESIFTLWSLRAAGKSRDRSVVISHESALHYYGLLPEAPQAIHLCVSSAWNRPEQAGCIFHRDELKRADYNIHRGFRITTVAKTLQMMRSDLLLRQAWGQTLLLARTRFRLDEDHLLALGNGVECPGREPAPVADFAAMPERCNVRTPKCEATGFSGLSPQRRGWMMAQRTFTLIEMLVVIAIIAVLASLLMPALQNALEQAKIASCANNQKQVAAGIIAYAGDFGGWVPPQESTYGGWYGGWGGLYSNSASWTLLLTSYATYATGNCPTLPSLAFRSFLSSVIVCGETLNWNSATDTSYYHYVTIRKLGKYESVSTQYPARSSSRVLTTDLISGMDNPTKSSTYLGWAPGWFGAHTGRGANSSFEDGHVQWFTNPLGRVPSSYDEAVSARPPFHIMHWSQTPYVAFRDH